MSLRKLERFEIPSIDVAEQRPSIQAISVAAQEALTALSQKEFAKAVDIYRKLLQIVPDVPAFWCSLSFALRNLGQREAALSCARRASALDPTNPDWLVNVSDSLVCLDQLDEALEIIAKVVKFIPKNITYRHRYADLLRQHKRFEEALAQINIISETHPDDVETNWLRGVIHLMTGNLKAGWKDYETRWLRGNLKVKNCGVPLWAGEDLTGKTILLHEEQGFGDTILAARYIPLVKQRGGRVLVQCKPALHKLFSTVPGIDRLPLEGPLGERFHYHAPLFSLPGIFGTELETIPPAAPLCPATAQPPAVSSLLAIGKDRFKVGIVWSGEPKFKNNYKRAVPFSRFLPLTQIPGIQFYSLQKGAAEKELSEAGAESIVLELGPHLKDFSETAAVLKQLDLIIMTDSSVAHLAGSLSVPVWNLLHADPFWLYMTDRQDSPWYPSMRLFRQPKPGDWDSVFKEVAAELQKTVAAKYHNR